MRELKKRKKKAEAGLKDETNGEVHLMHIRGDSSLKGDTTLFLIIVVSFPCKAYDVCKCI